MTTADISNLGEDGGAVLGVQGSCERQLSVRWAMRDG